MKRKWNIVFYETAKEECPVEDFIDSRSITNRAKILNWIEQLEALGPNLPRPYADLLEDGIHDRDFIVLTHAFRKNTDKVPKTEIKKAKKYRDDFIARFNENELRSRTNENI